MSKPNKGQKPKHQGFMDKVLHGDHSKDSDCGFTNPEGSFTDPVEDDVPVEPVSKKKVSVGPGASSESKHQHRKFDKFK